MAMPDTNTSTTGGPDTYGQGGGNGMMSKVREKATAQLTSQKDKATSGLGTVAQAVRQSTQQLRNEQHDTLAGYVESAADQIDRLSRKLRDKDVGELFRDAQALARRQPAVFIGSAFALGLLGARFLKSSSRPDEDDRRGIYGGERYGTTAYGRGQYGGTSMGTGQTSTGTGTSGIGTPATPGMPGGSGTAAGASKARNKSGTTGPGTTSGGSGTSGTERS